MIIAGSLFNIAFRETLTHSKLPPGLPPTRHLSSLHFLVAGHESRHFRPSIRAFGGDGYPCSATHVIVVEILVDCSSSSQVPSQRPLPFTRPDPSQPASQPARPRRARRQSWPKSQSTPIMPRRRRRHRRHRRHTTTPPPSTSPTPPPTITTSASAKMAPTCPDTPPPPNRRRGTYNTTCCKF